MKLNFFGGMFASAGEATSNAAAKMKRNIPYLQSYI